MSENIQLELMNDTRFLSEKWVGWLNDKEVVKFSGQSLRSHTLESQREFLNRKLADQTSLIFAVMMGNEHIGNVELGKIDVVNGSCEVMYVIGEKQYWGKGVGTRAVQLAVEYAFDRLDLTKVSAGTYGNNIGSQKVLTKIGFKMEGQAEPVLFGSEHTTKVRFALTKKDFEESHGK